LAIYALDLAKKQKSATLKDLRSINRILQKVREKESKIVFKKIAEKGNLCVLGISDASYHQDENAVSGEMILLGNTKTVAASPMFWKSGVIRKVCLSPKATETRSLLRLVDDSLCLVGQLEAMLNTKIETRLFTDSRPLLESIGSSGQIEEKALRQSVASLKQNLEDGEVGSFAWIAGTKIVADMFMKQGSQREALDEIVLDNVFRHAQTVDNLVLFENEEIQIKNLVTKAGKQT